jgi:SpoVK/Ycf46/Vps4 family AAA+-type ATPase
MGITDNSNTWPLLAPTLEERKSFWVPDRFRERVIVHIIKNNLSNISAPLILAIQGPQGDGKSSQVREVCSHLGAYIVPVSGATLSGAYEKDSVNTLKSAYVYASSVRQERKALVVLLVDDFDLSVASKFDDSRNTVNTQLLSGFLMNLSDNPTACEEQRTYRIPIIVTGNNFTALHPPLTRHGRMDIFDWEPTPEEKYEIVKRIFSGVIRPNEQDKFQKLVIERNKEEPIAFFTSLLVDITDARILDIVRTSNTLDLSRIQKLVDDKIEISTDQIAEFAAQRRLLKTRNYL